MDNISPITVARFWSKVDVKPSVNDCWEWKGCIKGDGYGHFRLPGQDRRMIASHRLAYRLANGSLPGVGLILRHKCDNPKCVNPHHLVEGTHKDNAADKIERGRMKTGDQSRENNGAAKLTWDDVVKIRERSSRGESKLNRRAGCLRSQTPFGSLQNDLSMRMKPMACELVATTNLNAGQHRRLIMSKAKYLEDAALVIDGRTAALEAEFQRDVARGVEAARLAPDRAAILEAKHLSRLIRSLKKSTYRDPYEAARKNWDSGRATDI